MLKSLTLTNFTEGNKCYGEIGEERNNGGSQQMSPRSRSKSFSSQRRKVFICAPTDMAVGEKDPRNLRSALVRNMSDRPGISDRLGYGPDQVRTPISKEKAWRRR